MHYLRPDSPALHRPGQPPLLLSVQPPAQDVALTMTTVHCSQLTAEAMAEVGFESLVDASASAKAQYFLLQFAFVGTQLVQDPLHTGVWVQWGSAVRVGIKSLNTSAKVTANIAELAASTELGLVSTSTSVTYLGIDQNLVKVLPAFQLNQRLDASMLQTLGEMIAIFQAKVTENPAYLQPVPLESESQATAETVGELEYLQSVSAAYALNAIASGQVLSGALSHLQSKIAGGGTAYDYALVDPLLVRSVYYQASGGDPDATTLGSTTKSNATKIYSATQI